MRSSFRAFASIDREIANSQIVHMRACNLAQMDEASREDYIDGCIEKLRTRSDDPSVKWMRAKVGLMFSVPRVSAKGEEEDAEESAQMLEGAGAVEPLESRDFCCETIVVLDYDFKSDHVAFSTMHDEIVHATLSKTRLDVALSEMPHPDFVKPIVVKVKTDGTDFYYMKKTALKKAKYSSVWQVRDCSLSSVN
jgi:hypothetical protein